jgi:hypothetical protein
MLDTAVEMWRYGQITGLRRGSTHYCSEKSLAARTHQIDPLAVRPFRACTDALRMAAVSLDGMIDQQAAALRGLRFEKRYPLAMAMVFPIITKVGRNDTMCHVINYPSDT